MNAADDYTAAKAATDEALAARAAADGISSTVSPSYATVERVRRLDHTWSQLYGLHAKEDARLDRRIDYLQRRVDILTWTTLLLGFAVLCGLVALIVAVTR